MSVKVFQQSRLGQIGLDWPQEAGHQGVPLFPGAGEASISFPSPKELEVTLSKLRMIMSYTEVSPAAPLLP